MGLGDKLLLAFLIFSRCSGLRVLCCVGDRALECDRLLMFIDSLAVKVLRGNLAWIESLVTVLRNAIPLFDRRTYLSELALSKPTRELRGLRVDGRGLVAVGALILLSGICA